jgi:hypothetical protein
MTNSYQSPDPLRAVWKIALDKLTEYIESTALPEERILELVESSYLPFFLAEKSMDDEWRVDFKRPDGARLGFVIRDSGDDFLIFRNNQ